jgi:signal transduction histidine kinase
VRQVLSNLLANAIKFTARGSVTVRVREEGSCAVFAITDTGRGIHPEDLERIFEPFTQVSTLDEGRAPGTGLGLSISRRLADLLHGSLTVTSEPSEGSTFTLTIPIDVPVAPTGQVSTSESRTGEQDVGL